MTSLPQVLVNVPRRRTRTRRRRPVGRDEVADAEVQLDGQGRVLVRASGTEPLVRVMVEAPTVELANAVAADLAAIVRRSLHLNGRHGGRGEGWVASQPCVESSASSAVLRRGRPRPPQRSSAVSTLRSRLDPTSWAVRRRSLRRSAAPRPARCARTRVAESTRSRRSRLGSISSTRSLPTSERRLDANDPVGRRARPDRARSRQRRT